MRSFKRFWRPIWLCLIILGILWVEFFIFAPNQPPIEVLEENPAANNQNSFHPNPIANKQDAFHQPLNEQPNDSNIFDSKSRIKKHHPNLEQRKHEPILGPLQIDENNAEIKNHAKTKNNFNKMLNAIDVKEVLRKKNFRKKMEDKLRSNNQMGKLGSENVKKEINKLGLEDTRKEYDKLGAEDIKKEFDELGADETKKKLDKLGSNDIRKMIKKLGSEDTKQQIEKLPSEDRQKEFDKLGWGDTNKQNEKLGPEDVNKQIDKPKIELNLKKKNDSIKREVKNVVDIPSKVIDPTNNVKGTDTKKVERPKENEVNFAYFLNIF